MIFHSLSHQNFLFSKTSDDVIACDLRFSPPPIQNPGYAYALNYVQYAYQISVIASSIVGAPLRAVAYNTAKVQKQQNICCIASSLKFLWYGSMEWNMKKNFSVEWNMEWKIFNI